MRGNSGKKTRQMLVWGMFAVILCGCSVSGKEGNLQENTQNRTLQESIQDAISAADADEAGESKEQSGEGIADNKETTEVETAAGETSGEEAATDSMIIDMDNLPTDDFEYTEIDLDMYVTTIRIDIGDIKQKVTALNLTYDDADCYEVPVTFEPWKEGDYASFEYIISLEGPHDFSDFVDGETVTFTLYLYPEFSEEDLPFYTREDSIGSVAFDYTFNSDTEECVYLLTETEDGRFQLIPQ